MFDRFVTSMNSAWISTKQAVQDSVEFAKDNTTRQFAVSDTEVQQANEKYEKILTSIKFITMKIELLNSEFIASSQHLVEMSSAFYEMIDFVDQTRKKNAQKEGDNDNNNNNKEIEEKIEEGKVASEQQLESIKTFATLVRNLGEQVIPKYVLKNFEPIHQRLINLKETRDAVHKLCLDMDLIKKQMTGTVTKPIVGKMQKPQQKLTSMANKLATLKPEYLQSIADLSQDFHEVKKNSYTTLLFYEQQYLKAIGKYILNPKAIPSSPPFTDYSDMTSILPNYLQLLTSKKQTVDDE